MAKKRKITEMTCVKCGFTEKSVNGMFQGWNDIGCGDKMKGDIPDRLRHIYVCDKCMMEMQSSLDYWASMSRR